MQDSASEYRPWSCMKLAQVAEGAAQIRLLPGRCSLEELQRAAEHRLGLVVTGKAMEGHPQAVEDDRNLDGIGPMEALGDRQGLAQGPLRHGVSPLAVLVLPDGQPPAAARSPVVLNARKRSTRPMTAQ